MAANQPPTVKLSVTPATGTAPVSVTASTAGSTDVDGTITATTISWGDGTSTTAASASHMYSTTGTYAMTAKVTDDRGASSTASATVTVTAPATGGVKVSSPTPNSTVGSSVHFVATATPSGNSYITGMKVYVDSTLKYSVATASMNTYININRGSHSVTVKAWDSAGKIFSTSMTIRVK